eukprot:3188809-Prymnesium_polylepis.1
MFRTGGAQRGGDVGAKRIGNGGVGSQRRHRGCSRRVVHAVVVRSARPVLAGGLVRAAPVGGDIVYCIYNVA